MGVGQSRELLGKVHDDRVFVCTNRKELLELLMRLQKAFISKEEETNEGELEQSNEMNLDQQLEKDKQETTLADAGVIVDGNDISVPIEVIHVPNHYLGDDGFISGHPAILQSLAASTALRSLNIGYNALTSRSIEALVGGSGMPPNLQSLNLAGNKIGLTGCNQLAAFLATNPPLCELSLFHNELYDRDVEPILRGLVQNTNLRLLNLDCNYLTGHFLRLLLELLEQNTTLAVVLFDGPYNPETLERTRELTPEEVIPGTDVDMSAAARALLRRRLLRADLAGRVPFPSALVQEVEGILAPRRIGYMAERETKEAEMATLEAATAKAEGRLCEDAACSTLNLLQRMSGDGHNETDEKADENEAEQRELTDMLQPEQDELPSLEKQLREEVDLSTEWKKEEEEEEGERGSWQTSENLGQTPRSHLSTSRMDRETMKFNNDFHERRFSRRLPMRSSRSTNTMLGATRASILKRSLVGGKELSNGFDRLMLEPRSAISGAMTVWQKISGPPCRLRACWCDPRDVPAPYGRLLHYHCKHEPTSGNLGEVGVNGQPLKSDKKISKRSQQVSARHDLQNVLSDELKPRRAPYTGCKETSHCCESIGFYGNPRPDRSSMFFFASQHPMRAGIVEYEGTS